MESVLTSPFRRPNQVIDGRYELVRLIGEGGMGEVWEARHIQLESPVAIKFAVERRASDKAFIERFRREACAMARLRSPDIVQVFDTGLYQGVPYLVMELLEGESLRERLEREPLLRLSVTSALAQQVGHALSVIHRKGMVHRDVTPANLFLQKATEDFPLLRVKLLDFGVAKDLTGEPKITTSGALIGSPAYMSPEQARSEVIDARTDLWSFGAVLYRAVVGEDAFEARSLTEVLFQICAGEVPRASERNPELPRAIDEFFERAFARNPVFRFTSGTEMADAFCAIVKPVLEREVWIDLEQSVRKSPSSVPLPIHTAPRATVAVSSIPTQKRLLAPFWPVGVVAIASVGLGTLIGARLKTTAPTVVSSTAGSPRSVTTSERAVVPPVATDIVLPVVVASSPTPSSIASYRVRNRDVVQVAKPPSSTTRQPTQKPAKVSERDVDPVFGLPLSHGN